MKIAGNRILFILFVIFIVFTPMLATAAIINAPTGRSATYVIAASDAPDHVRAQADYVCDGVADDVQIQAAINLGYSDIKLSAGTFTVNTTINITNAGYSIGGAGVDVTTLKLANGANTTIISLSNGEQTLQMLTINGNKANNTNTDAHGINATGAYNLRLLNLKIVSTAGDGIFASNVVDKLNFWFDSVYIFSSNGNGLNLKHMAGIMASGLESSTNAKNGMFLTSVVESFFTNSIFDSNSAGNISGHGVKAFDTFSLSFSNCYFGANGSNGINLFGTNNSTSVMNSVFNGNGSRDAFDGGIVSDTGGSHLTFIGNKFNQPGGGVGGSGIRTSAGCKYVLIENNNFYGVMYPFQASGGNISSFIVRSNIGYITENSGTFTIPAGTWGVVMPHGLAAPAMGVQLTFTCNTTANVYVSGITSTSFTANLSALQGSDVTGFWRATTGAGN